MDQTYIGAPIRRREDFRLLTGKATFTDDIKLHHMLHAAILRSPHAHARITSIDAARALALPGTIAVFTFQDIAPLAKPIPLRLYPLPGLEQFLQYPLAQDRVRYVGEPVAVVVAGVVVLRAGDPLYCPKGKRTAKVRAERSAEGAADALEEVRRVARGEENLLVPMREALRARCTIGEICDVLREEYGTYDAQRT